MADLSLPPPSSLFRRTILLLILLLPTVTQGFGNFPVSKIFAAPKTREETTAQILKELGVTSSTEPKRFSAPVQQIPSLLIASLPAVLRFGSGIFANGYTVSVTEETKRNDQYAFLSNDRYRTDESCAFPGRTTQIEPLVLYEFEQCPFCRKVREAVSILSLTVTFKPCPPNGRVYRTAIKEETATFPYLQDPNTGIAMSESDDILDYLFRTYGTNGNQLPWTLRGGPLVPLTAGLSLIVGGGGRVRNSNANDDDTNIELWSYEGSPFCKVVKERLCELELSHTQISCARGSPNRQLMYEQYGRFQAPFLRDSNGVAIWESQAILEYLDKKYGVADSPIKYL